MRMSEAEARASFVAAPVARLASADGHGRPHLVPVTFAVVDDAVLDESALDEVGAGETIVHAVDHKPKSTRRLRRLDNLRINPAATALVDHYDEDWTKLWWVRADGTATIVTAGPFFDEAIAALRRKYRAYAEHRPAGPVIALTVHRWSGWRAS